MLGIATLTGFAAEPVEVLQTYGYYNITGASISEINAQLTRGAPVDSNGDAREGIANSYITWKYPFQRDAKGCTTGPVSVQVQVHIQLPRWTRAAQASGDIARRWDKFIAALTLHEEGHKQIAVDGARRIASTLARLPAEASCPAMNAKANAEGQRLLVEIRAAQVRYDQMTNHGLTQGATSGL
jgi:predicted secreted Zn-dependent protease